MPSLFKSLVALAAVAGTLVNAQCITQYDANTLATNFGLLVSDYSQELANQTLTPDFLDYSESVNSVIDNGGTTPLALLGPTFTSRAAYEALSSQQPSVPYKVEQVWFNCQTITVRWISNQSPNPVVGISLYEVRLGPLFGNPSIFQIHEVYSEFDSVVWLENLGLVEQVKK